MVWSINIMKLIFSLTFFFLCKDYIIPKTEYKTDLVLIPRLQDIQDFAYMICNIK